MQLLIPLISSLLLMIQMPIQAEEGHSEPITMSIADLNILISNHKDALQSLDFNKVMPSANDLLGAYKNTNNPELKVKITEALLMKDSDQYTFLHYASWYNKSEIINTTIDALKDKPEILHQLLITANNKGDTFLNVSANYGYRDIINTTIDALKDKPEILHQLLITANDNGYTFLQLASLGDHSGIIQTTIEALKVDHIDILIELLDVNNIDFKPLNKFIMLSLLK